MCSQVSTTFPDSTYTSANKPSVETLKSDISAIETAHNDTDTNAVKTTDTDISSNSWVLDEDAMGSNSNQKVATQQSIKAYVDSMLEAIYPVGSIYISGSATMPTAVSSLGTWARVQGRMIVGASDTDGDFDNGDTGGAKTHTLTTAEMPTHTHTQNAHNHGVTDPGHAHTATVRESPDLSPRFQASGGNGSSTAGTNSNTTGISINNQTAVNQNAGGGNAHSIMNPYKAKYMWERVS